MLEPIIYDNNGETIDRYTVILIYDKKQSLGDVYGMSDNPLSPQGFNQWVGKNWELPRLNHLGKKVNFKDLSKDVKKAIKLRMEAE